MKVSELSGALLDYWVAMAEGMGGAYGPRLANWSDGTTRCLLPAGVIGEHGPTNEREYSPTASWEIVGLIMERHRIALIPEDGVWVALWQPEAFPTGVISCSGAAVSATWPRTAALRCYLLQKLGLEVPDEVRV